MTDVKWMIKAREFVNCNCAYGCPCQFNALPTHGNCAAVVGIQIDSGHHGDTSLNGLRIAGVYSWPGPIHLGDGQVVAFIDKRAGDAQRGALLRILTGQDTTPGATIFNVFAATLSKAYDPVFTDIDFEVDVKARRAKLKVDGYIELRGEPILNAVTGAEFRGAIVLEGGFEYARAEMGRGWSKTDGPIKLEFADSYGQFAHLHLNQDGVVH